MTYEELLAENKELKQQISFLKGELAQLKKLIFGQKSERFVPNNVDVDQLGFFEPEVAKQEDQGPEETEQINYTRSKQKKHKGRRPLPDHLPVEVHVLQPEQDTVGLKQIGTEVTEKLDYRPAKLVRIRYERPKYVQVSKDEQTGQATEKILIADLPIEPIPKGIAKSGLLAYLIVSKFVDHLPFYRIIQMFKRDYGYELCDSTLNGWFVSCSALLEPLYNKLKQKVLQSDYLQVDETPIRVLESEQKGKSHRGFQWVYHSVEQGLVLFHYRKGRGENGPKEVLAGYEGYLQCDGYTVYDKIGKQEGITLIGCIAHSRRKFHNALGNAEQLAKAALEQFKEIYVIERKYRQNKITAIERRDQINEKLEGLKKWVEEKYPSTLPKSDIHKAMKYFLNQWHKLKNVTLDPRVRIDNNIVENRIRPLALGRKNYLFAGNHNAAQRIAMYYSFFASCKSQNVNPWEWLKTTLDRIPTHPINRIEELLPSNYNTRNSVSSHR